LAPVLRPHESAHPQAHGGVLPRVHEEPPGPQVTLNITQDLAAYAPDIRDRLKNKILRDKIGSVMATLRHILETGSGDKTHFKRQLQKLVLQATNLKRPDGELIELLREAEELFEELLTVGTRSDSRE
jgi:hypothetical protein